MISLEKCRAILGIQCTLSDGQSELLLEQLYALADVVTTTFIEEHSKKRQRKEQAQSNDGPIARAS